MSASFRTIIRCDRIGCTAKLDLGYTAATARRIVEGEGWKVGVRSRDPRRPEDYCPEHKR